MLRLIIQTTDFGEAANVGGPVITRLRTIDVELPEVEKHLREFDDAKANGKTVWSNRQLIGVEVIKSPKSFPQV